MKAAEKRVSGTSEEIAPTPSHKRKSLRKSRNSLYVSLLRHRQQQGPRGTTRASSTESFSDATASLSTNQHPPEQRRNRRVQKKRSAMIQPRMVARDLPFHQSRNRMNVRNIDPHRWLWKLQILDWFHTLLRFPIGVAVGILLGVWIFLVVAFAVAYWYEDNVGYKIVDCGMGLTASESLSMSGAFAFSLETWTTVGYGLPGTSYAFFEKGCYGIQGMIFLEMVCSMMFNSFMFAFFFALMSKSEFRSTQIIFTNKLLVNIEQDKAYVRLQCYDIDSAHPLVEAHARMYFLDHKLRMHPLRLMDPNDDLGGVLYPSVPADIVHHIDHHSALCPPGVRHELQHCIASSHGMALRSLDSYVGNRDQFVCPVCGDAFGTLERWKLHVEYNARLEASMSESDLPPDKSHRGLLAKLPPYPRPMVLEEVQQYIEKTLSEIIVVVEATDPQLSGSFQALQSYKYEDIVFGAEYAKCMSTVYEANDGATFCVDMEQFHDTTCKRSQLKRPTGLARSDSNKTTLSALTTSQGERFPSLEISEDAESSDESSGGSSPAGDHHQRRTDAIVLFQDDSEHDDVESSTRTDDSRIVPKSESSHFGRSYYTFNSVVDRNGWDRALREDVTDGDDDRTSRSSSHGESPSSRPLLDIEEGSRETDTSPGQYHSPTTGTTNGIPDHEHDTSNRTEDSTLVPETDKTYFGRSYDTFNSLRMRGGWSQALLEHSEDNDNEGATRDALDLGDEPLLKPYSSTV